MATEMRCANVGPVVSGRHLASDPIDDPPGGRAGGAPIIPNMSGVAASASSDAPAPRSRAGPRCSPSQPPRPLGAADHDASGRPPDAASTDAAEPLRALDDAAPELRRDTASGTAPPPPHGGGGAP